MKWEKGMNRSGKSITIQRCSCDRCRVQAALMAVTGIKVMGRNGQQRLKAVQEHPEIADGRS
jgi:hypothetical protein